MKNNPSVSPAYPCDRRDPTDVQFAHLVCQNVAWLNEEGAGELRWEHEAVLETVRDRLDHIMKGRTARFRERTRRTSEQDWTAPEGAVWNRRQLVRCWPMAGAPDASSSTCVFLTWLRGALMFVKSFRMVGLLCVPLQLQLHLPHAWLGGALDI